MTALYHTRLTAIIPLTILALFSSLSSLPLSAGNKCKKHPTQVTNQATTQVTNQVSNQATTQVTNQVTNQAATKAATNQSSNQTATKATTQNTTRASTTFTIDPTTIISRDYIGNGVQWDPYEKDFGNGPVEISDADWKKLYDRLDFMKPGFIRVIGGAAGSKDNEHIRRILDYCQSRGITVMYGDWGNGLVSYKDQTVNEQRLKLAAEGVNTLVNKDGYDCIKYYNLVNEPNGNWSATNGDLKLWLKAADVFCRDLGDIGFKPSLSAPDIAIFSTAYTDWITATRKHLDENVGVYDIHTYPTKSLVNSERYSDMIKAYKSEVPDGKKIIMGELGFKYNGEDKELRERNKRMIEACPHASREDSQMLVFDHMYGTDMADAVFQTINCGFSGCLAWMLDDAMHRKEKLGMLKIWGFWNIFGDEIFGPEHEVVRPWYYAWSLLCRYIPSGCNVFKVSRTGDPSVKAVAIEKDGCRTIAFVNTSTEAKTVSIAPSPMNAFRKARKYSYTRDAMKTRGDHELLPDSSKFNFAPGDILSLPGESLTVITEIKY